MLYPLLFQPIFKERIWGGRSLERLYDKQLPPGPVGESWEVTDRPEGVSVIDRGPLAGKDLRWLMENQARELLGAARSTRGRFPLLVKILDAREKLSLQVHPPASIAGRLGGEPKTEMWYITEAAPEAELYVGLKRGITKPDFAQSISDGSVADCFNRLRVRPGDAIFLPSGRVHAIGAGNVIFEIQQNSDTTYRVFDWNRRDDTGKPRELHVAQSLESIDFDDCEPSLIERALKGTAHKERTLVDDPLFRVREHHLEAGVSFELAHDRCAVLAAISGSLSIEHPSEPVKLAAGMFSLIPACVMPVRVRAESDSAFLEAIPG